MSTNPLRADLNRAKQIKSTKGDLKQSITLFDIDYAMMTYLEDTVLPPLDDNGKVLKTISALNDNKNILKHVYDFALSYLDIFTEIVNISDKKVKLTHHLLSKEEHEKIVQREMIAPRFTNSRELKSKCPV
jgi:hypothetical protein